MKDVVGTSLFTLDTAQKSEILRMVLNNPEDFKESPVYVICLSLMGQKSQSKSFYSKLE